MKVIIQSDKKTNYWVLFMFFYTFAGSYLLYISSYSLPVSGVFCGLSFVFTLRFWIAIGRTITLDSDQITVSFLFFTKRYSFDQLKLKREFSNKNGFVYRVPYTDGVELAFKPIKRPPWIQPLSYCVWVHPFSYIVIHFEPKPQNANECPAIYESDKATILPLINR